MIQENLLLDLFYYFGATVICVPLFRIVGLGSVLGYLVAGIILGKDGLGLLHHAKNIQEVSQIGIIMLLFVIGLELTTARINHLKKVIFGIGPIQFFVTTALFTTFMKFFGLSWSASFFVGAALSLSSTAFALTWLKDTEQLTHSFGQTSFGVLIFQDLVIIPLLTMIPFFAAQNSSGDVDFVKLGLSFLAIFASIPLAKIAVTPVLKKIYISQSKEIFIGTCLMLMIGSSLLMEQAGLSKALGAFLAGIYLSGSGLRSDIQSFSIPLKSMVMGVFFMGFGLSFDFDFFREHWVTICMLTSWFMLAKFIILAIIGRAVHGDWTGGYRLGLVLCQGGEFGFLVAASLVSYQMLPVNIANYLVASITLSIFIAPFLTKIIEYTAAKKAVPAESEELAEVIPLPVAKTEEIASQKIDKAS